MSNKSGHKIPGYFSYVVPPLEGLWSQEGQETAGIDFTRKDRLNWISMIRLPEFVTKEVFDWAITEASEKKQTDFSSVEFFPFHEGFCIQCMHIGPYDGCLPDLSASRLHHKIYLSDPRRCAPQRLKTVIRQPVKKHNSF